MQIKMKETTRGSKHKEYDYTLEKQDLEEPNVRFLPDNTKLITTHKINVYPFVSNSVGGYGHNEAAYGHDEEAAGHNEAAYGHDEEAAGHDE
jgi:hypothetical protein